MSNKEFIGYAINIGKLSPCKKNKVGAVIVKNDKVIIQSYNASLHTNYKHDPETRYLTTFCAEKNAILEAKQNLEGASIYITLSPCMSCAAMILKCGISKVYYLNEYNDTRSIDFLRESGVKVIKCIFPEYKNLKPNNLKKL